MNGSLLLVLGVILALTIMFSIALRDWTVRAPAVVVIYGLVFSLLVGLGGAYNRLTQQRVYDQCTYSVTRSEGNRAYQLVFISIVEREIPDSGIAAELTHALDEFLPIRDIKECKKP